MKAKVKKMMNVRKVEPSTSCKDTSNFQDYKLHDVNPGARLGPYTPKRKNTVKPLWRMVEWSSI